MSDDTRATEAGLRAQLAGSQRSLTNALGELREAREEAERLRARLHTRLAATEAGRDAAWRIIEGLEARLAEVERERAFALPVECSFHPGRPSVGFGCALCARAMGWLTPDDKAAIDAETHRVLDAHRREMEALRARLAEVERNRDFTSDPKSTPQELERMGLGMRHSFSQEECPVCESPECRHAAEWTERHRELVAIRHRAEQARADYLAVRTENDELRTRLAEMEAGHNEAHRLLDEATRKNVALRARLAERDRELEAWQRDALAHAAKVNTENDTLCARLAEVERKALERDQYAEASREWREAKDTAAKRAESAEAKLTAARAALDRMNTLALTALRPGEGEGAAWALPPKEFLSVIRESVNTALATIKEDA